MNITAAFDSKEDQMQFVDRRLVVLESMSAECSALLTKVVIKRHRSRKDVSVLDVPVLDFRDRSLIPT